MIKHRLFKVLMKRGLLDKERVEECLNEEYETGHSIGRILREKGLVNELDFLRVYHKISGVPFYPSLKDFHVPKEFVTNVPAQVARSHNLVAIKSSPGLYVVATCDPLDVYPMDDLSSMLSAEIEPVLATKSEITELINRGYQRSADGVDEMLEGIEEDDMLMAVEVEEEAEDVLDIANKAPIIRLLNSIIFEAIKTRASDIHLQPFNDSVVVRFRIDGILYNMKTIPKKVQDAMISRVKVMGKMDIAERRLPQDGRAAVRVGDGEVDLRISSVPTAYGERIVFRLLDKTQKVFSLEEIGLSDEHFRLINHVIGYSHGIVLVTGPTGSGKTTTLYATLTRMNSQEKNIITIEDPIEYQLPAVSQIQVSNKKGLTFAAGLRSLLRQDPDVMMVGEIRDVETARIAIQAALTGHLVFSTLHTNDAASAVTRLLDIGIEPYLVASSLIAVIAQRLVRLICPECKSEYEPTDPELAEINLSGEDLDEGVLWVGMGCDACLNTGYQKRTAIYEMLPIGDEVRKQIIDRVGASKIKSAAIERGVGSMRMDGALKVLTGQTTIEEVLRVTQADLA